MRFRKSRWAWGFRFSLVVGWSVRSCGYVAFCHVLSLGLPLTAPLYQFCWMQAHFTNVAGCKNIVKCVRAAETSRKWVSRTVYTSNDTDYPTQAIQFSIQSMPLTIQLIPYRYQTKQSTQSRSAQILRKAIAKTTVAAGTNDLPHQ